MYNAIPDEMKEYRQFVVWRYEEVQDGKPTKVPYCPHNNRRASCNDPNTWGSFQDVLNVVDNFSGIGFVLTDNDPYTFIDLDEPKAHVSQEDRTTAIERQIKIYNEFNSYAERSPSKTGLHIIVKGSVESGRKRSFIELYSSQRFMTMTGDVYRQAPITDHNEILNVLWAQMGGGANAYSYNGDVEETESDDTILDRAKNAANGDKFAALLEGNWQDYYPSQSEADFAFIDIIAFYTQSHAQITRIYRNSALGQTSKSGYAMRGLRVDYVNYMINKSFDRMLPPVDVDGLRIQLEQALAQNRACPMPEPAISEDCLKNRLPNLPYSGTLDATPTLPLTQNAPVAPVQASVTPAPTNYTIPPGLVGEIAKYIYASAVRPVPEIALAGAIGLMAGICGRSFNVSGTGLNQYVLLLARTGRGKEAMATAFDKLMNEVRRTVPSANEFIGPAVISSPQALTKYMAKTSASFVSLLGEYGITAQEMSAWNASPPQVGLRKMLLDLYNKSGEGKILKETIYSESMKNTEPVLAPAFSILGESNPEEYYKGLNENMITSGLLPRFTVIEYHGKREARNKDFYKAQPSFELIERLSTLCAHSLMLNNANKAVHVDYTPEALAALDAFDVESDNKINAEENAIKEELWNRAHMKVLKLSALIAVGVNPFAPIITLEYVQWAHKVVVDDINNLLARFERGDIGVDTEETKQVNEVIKAFYDYCTRDYAYVDKYKTSTPKMHYDKVVTMAYLSKRLPALAAFRKDRIGATNAIKRTIETLKANGDIRELGPKQISEMYNYSGKVFAIVNLHTFGIKS